MEFVTWDDDIPKYDGKNKIHVPKHQSVIHLFCRHIHMHHGQFHTHTVIYIIFIYNVYMQAFFFIIHEPEIIEIVPISLKVYPMIISWHLPAVS